jgi:hypothetical protein
MSTYFGSMTIVLKLPLTRAASTKGLQRYKGFCGVLPPGEGGTGPDSDVGVVADVGVGERFGPRGPRLIERLDIDAKIVSDGFEKQPLYECAPKRVKEGHFWVLRTRRALRKSICNGGVGVTVR